LFNYYNASTIAKSLTDNGFFKAKHTVCLHGQKEQKEIKNEKELEAIIQAEKDTIANDPSLKAKFTEIALKLDKNIQLRDFYNYLVANLHILPELSNPEKFSEKVWKSYFKIHEALYQDAVDKIQATQRKTEELEKQAEQERTRWDQVIEIFNSRFYVPFKVEAKDRVANILGHEKLVQFTFRFNDGQEEATLQEKQLLQSLSMGERKALYILNILFEVQTRLLAKQETLFIVDDIADSFDYRNKYAIVEYLRDLADEPNFRLLILTHNFDFYRTVVNRLSCYGSSLIALKSDTGISLAKAAGINNVFIKDWKAAFFTDLKKRIASLPFLRNLIEFTKEEDDPSYVALTSLLHWKPDTPTITEGTVDQLYKSVFPSAQQCANPATLYVDSLRTAADACAIAPDGLNFENKIVLSVAIRLLADKYMITKINDPAFVQSLDRNQTSGLFKEFQRKCSGDPHLPTLLKVMVMTPENLHLNAFMYEPIIDMSDKHLRDLYTTTKAL
jgi:ABC-type lipoprotein export system ATPase subunit